MITSTFCHLSGIGERTEHDLWTAGWLTWDGLACATGLRGRLAALPARIAESQQALAARSWPHFASILHGRHAWRWLDTLADRVVYLDIETTGGPPGHDAVTVVSGYDGREVSLFVRDENLADFPPYLAQFDLLVSYNGASFDVPHLRAHFPLLRVPPVHLDLRYPLRNLGYRGGLKRAEVACGLAREDGLAELDGLAAIWLWERHQSGDSRALPTLLRYAAEDVVGLEPLAALVYNRSSELLPPPAAPVGPAARRSLDLPFDRDLIGECQAALTAWRDVGWR